MLFHCPCECTCWVRLWHSELSVKSSIVLAMYLSNLSVFNVLFNICCHGLPFQIRVMWTRKRLFPSKRRYLFFLLPGIVLALTGIGVNFGFTQHKSTYQYTHSFWHFSLMIAPCFLMPPRRKPNSGEFLVTHPHLTNPMIHLSVGWLGFKSQLSDTSDLVVIILVADLMSQCRDWLAWC